MGSRRSVSSRYLKLLPKAQQKLTPPYRSSLIQIWRINHSPSCFCQKIRYCKVSRHSSPPLVATLALACTVDSARSASASTVIVCRLKRTDAVSIALRTLKNAPLIASAPVRLERCGKYSISHESVNRFATRRLRPKPSNVDSAPDFSTNSASSCMRLSIARASQSIFQKMDPTNTETKAAKTSTIF